MLWRRQWHPTPVLLPGKSHGRRSLVGCSPWGRTESDMTERLHFHFSPSCIGEGNGNPLQCSCLENPRDGEACWAPVYGVTQSRTGLKRLSSSRPCYIIDFPKEISPEYSLEGLMLKLKLPVHWPPDAKNWLIWKDPDAGKDWRRQEKRMTEDEIVGWHHWLNGQEFE